MCVCACTCMSVCTCRVRSSAEAWGIVLYICPSISLSWDTMGAKSWSRVFTDFSKMAHTAWGTTWDQLYWNVLASDYVDRFIKKAGLWQYVAAHVDDSPPQPASRWATYWEQSVWEQTLVAKPPQPAKHKWISFKKKKKITSSIRHLHMGACLSAELLMTMVEWQGKNVLLTTLTPPTSDKRCIRGGGSRGGGGVKELILLWAPCGPLRFTTTKLQCAGLQSRYMEHTVYLCQHISSIDSDCCW